MITMSLVTLFIGLLVGHLACRAYRRALDRTGAHEDLGRFLGALPCGIVYFWVVWIPANNYLETLPYVYFKVAPLLRFIEEGAIPLTITFLALPLLVLLAAIRRRVSPRVDGDADRGAGPPRDAP